jgi:hypothetical protein
MKQSRSCVVVVAEVFSECDRLLLATIQSGLGFLQPLHLKLLLRNSRPLLFRRRRRAFLHTKLAVVKPHKRPGYSKCIQKRLHEYRERETSWLANLVESACRLEFGHKAFFFGDYVACFVATYDEVPVAEALIGTITDSSIETGGGFTVYQGGIQVSGRD